MHHLRTLLPASCLLMAALGAHPAHALDLRQVIDDPAINAFAQRKAGAADIVNAHTGVE